MEKAISKVPTDISTVLAAILRKLGLANTPIVPTITVKIASGHTQGTTMTLSAPAPSPKMTVNTRNML